jgi:alpha-mannosidase
VDGAKPAIGFDDSGRSLPAEMLPSILPYAGVDFRIARSDRDNATVARGQTIPLPHGKFNRIYVLAASANGDQKATFRVGDQALELNIEDWGGYIGQWDNRTWDTRQEPVPPRSGAPPPAPGTPPRMRTVMEHTGLVQGFIKPAPVAWFASHHHSAQGANVPYAYSYLFAYTFDAPTNAKTITLPNNDKVRILAITTANESPQVRPAQPLYDTLEPRPR